MTNNTGACCNYIKIKSVDKNRIGLRKAAIGTLAKQLTKLASRFNTCSPAAAFITRRKETKQKKQRTTINVRFA